MLDAQRKKAEERERIRKTLAEDRNLRFQGAVEPTAPTPLRPSEAGCDRVPVTAGSGMGSSAQAAAPADAATTLRVRLEGGDTLTLDLRAGDTLGLLLDRVMAERAARDATDPFLLRAVVPPMDYPGNAPSEVRDITLAAAGLAPRATLTVVAESSRGQQRASLATEAAGRGGGPADHIPFPVPGGAVPPEDSLAAALGSLVGLRVERLDEAALNRLQARVLADAEECVPNCDQELDVFLVGPSAESCAGAGLLSQDRALEVCSGRQDFILFEPMDEAVRRGERVVIAAQRGDASMRSAQAYLARSVRRWLLELKCDGAGRVIQQTRNLDPITRRRFTREQVVAILHFGAHLPVPQTTTAETENTMPMT